MKLKADMTNEIGVGRPRCGNGIFVILTLILAQTDSRPF